MIVLTGGGGLRCVLRVGSGVRPLITSFLDGYNVCIFAYGQTGSGKVPATTHHLPPSRHPPCLLPFPPWPHPPLAVCLPSACLPALRPSPWRGQRLTGEAASLEAKPRVSRAMAGPLLPICMDNGGGGGGGSNVEGAE